MGEGRTANMEQGALLGQVINGHEIVRLLGVGGMGEVYLARHTVLGMLRAIKVIHDDHKADANAAARFEREALVLARLRHPNIVQVIDFGQLPNGWPFLAMEYIEGPNLEEAVEANGPLALADALQVLVLLAGVLELAHGQGIVHRDLKPANVLLRRGDPRAPAVIDFGLARMISNELMTRLTAERQMVGSPLYMAPEQADGSPEITGAVDVYALAGIAYALISGQAVFPGRPLLALIYAHAEEVPPRLSERCPFAKVPRLLDELLLACLGKRPADRPTSDELAAHLANLLAQAEIDPAARVQIALDQTMAAPDAAAVTTPARPRPPVSPGPEARAAAGSLSVRGAGAYPGGPTETPSVRVSDSLMAEVGEGAAVPGHAGTCASALLYAAPGDDDPLREAWSNQILAVIMEIAASMADHDAGVSARLQAVEALLERITDVELDLALLDSHLGEAPVADRATLEAERSHIAARTAGLQRELTTVQRDLVARVEGARPAAEPEVEVLFRELDDILQQARPAFASTRG